MILKRAKIQEFQSHRESLIEFCPGVNVFIGNTDEGKSALIRALRWVMRNKVASGFWNITAEAEGKDCSVGLAISDGEKEVRVIRRRTKSSNFYVVIDGENRQEFTAFGRDIPDPVKALLGEPVIFGKDLVYDLNISPQVEMPFLLSENPRNFTRVLGKLTGIDVLDTAEGLMATRARELAGKSKTLREERDQVQLSFDALPDPVVVTRLLDLAEELATKAAGEDRKANELQDTVAKLKHNAERLEEAHELYQRTSLCLEPIETGHAALTLAANRLLTLISLRNNLVTLEDRLQKARIKAKMLPVAPSATLIGIEEDAGRLTALETLCESLSELGSQIERKTKGLKDTETLLRIERDRLTEMLTKIEACPLSGGRLFDECRELLKK